MLLTKWQPIPSLSAWPNQFFADIDNLLAHFWDDDQLKAGGLKEAEWTPRVDVYENKDNFVVKAELPGIDPKDLEVRIEDETLYLKGERKLEKEQKEENYYKRERAYGSFARSFSLPSSVNTEKVLAEYKDGLLRLTLPKWEEAKPKSIQVAVK